LHSVWHVGLGIAVHKLAIPAKGEAKGLTLKLIPVLHRFAYYGSASSACQARILVRASKSVSSLGLSFVSACSTQLGSSKSLRGALGRALPRASWHRRYHGTRRRTSAFLFLLLHSSYRPGSNAVVPGEMDDRVLRTCPYPARSCDDDSRAKGLMGKGEERMAHFITTTTAKHIY
jgi:hypothetical protein